MAEQIRVIRRCSRSYRACSSAMAVSWLSCGLIVERYVALDGGNWLYRETSFVCCASTSEFGSISKKSTFCIFDGIGGMCRSENCGFVSLYHFVTDSDPAIGFIRKASERKTVVAGDQ